MTQKILAIMFYTFMAAVVVLAGFLLNYQIQQNKHREETNSGINVVSQVEADYSEADLHSVKQKSVNVTLAESGLMTEGGEATTTASVLSYLEIYQHLQTANACNNFYKFWRSDGLAADIRKMVRPAVQLYGKTDYPADEQVPLSTAQTATLTQWVKRCYGLWTDYGVFNQADNKSIPINDISETLAKKLLTTVPQSKKGKAIKQTRQLAAQWQQRYAQLETTLEGEDSNQKVVNQELLHQVLADFQTQEQRLNHAFNSDVAEVFYEALMTAEGADGNWLHQLGFANHSTLTRPANQYRITPDQLVFEASGRQNRWLHSSVLRYATQWYLCELGMDCGSQSPIVMHYCLLGINSYPEACGKNLKDFFQQDLISPNRLQDVLQFKQHYQELFDE